MIVQQAIRWLNRVPDQTATSEGVRNALLRLVSVGMLALSLALPAAAAPRCSVETLRAVEIPLLPSFDGMRGGAVAPVLAELPAEFRALPKVPEAGHLIGPRVRVRSEDVGFEHIVEQRYVDIEVVVDERGDVLAARPKPGFFSRLDAFHAEALRIAKRWKFLPYLRNGVPQRVRVTAGVWLDFPETTALKPQPRPAIKNFDSLLIRYSGDGFDLTIHGSGLVEFVGKAGVAVAGRHCAVVSRASLERLVDAFGEAQFFSLDKRYDSGAKGHSASTISIAFDGRKKEMRDEASTYLPGAPDALRSLPPLILHAVQAGRWIDGNVYTLPSLIAEGWDLSPSNPANRKIMIGVVSDGDTEAVRALIEAGFPVDGDLVGVYRAGSLLEVAAQRNDDDMVQLLLSTKAVWRQATLDAVLLDAAWSADAAMIETLIARGANVHARGEYAMTPLLAAATRGDPAAIRPLLRAGASVTAVDEHRLSALHRLAMEFRVSPVRGHRAADRKAAVETLAAAGADANARDNDGETPLMNPWHGGGEAVAAALIAAGADVNARSDKGMTPLMACENAAVTKILLEAGADPYAELDGKTALDMAREEASREAEFEVLKEAQREARAVAAVLEAWMAAHPRSE